MRCAPGARANANLRAISRPDDSKIFRRALSACAFVQSCYGLRIVPADAWFCEVCMVVVRSAPELRTATFAADGGVVLPAGALPDFFSLHD